MVAETPVGYYDLLRDKVKDFKKMLVKPGFPGQAGEMNELQTMIFQKFEEFGNTIYKNGTWVYGGRITTLPNGDEIDVNITAGKIWANGEVHNIPKNGSGEPDAACTITGVGREIVFLELLESIVTIDEDPDLSDQAIGSENYQLEGADRLKFSYIYNTEAGIPIATFQDGILVIEPVFNALLDEIMRILAQRTREQSGSFVAERPKLLLKDRIDDYPSQMDLEIVNGIGYIRGWRRQNGQISVPIARTLEGMERVAEPEVFASGTKVYSFDNTPFLDITQLLATIQSPSITMSRGQTPNGSDPIPSEYQPVLNIVTVDQGGTHYDLNTDYTLSGNYITWVGDQPATGTTYTMTVQFTEELTLGNRVHTRVTEEVQSVVADECTTDNTDLRRIVRIVDADTELVEFIEGVDWEVEEHTGVVTWLESPGAIDVKIDYDYWEHETEGDYTARNSFVDAAGFPMPYATPTKTPTGLTIDYTTQLSFDVVDGQVPVNTSIFYATYNFALPRIDMLVWREDGMIQVLQGLPGLDPDPPLPSADQMPIITLKIPAEAVASKVKFEWAPNLTLHVTELNYLKTQINDIQYNQGRFQLANEAVNRPTATDKRGVFADDLSGPDLADLTHPDFSGSFDFLARTFSLPRIRHELLPATLASTGATLKNNSFWFPTYTNVLMLEQPYTSSFKKVITVPGTPVTTEGEVTLSPNHHTRRTKTVCEIKVETKKCEIPKKDCKHESFLRKCSTVSKNADRFIDKAKKFADEANDFKEKFKNKMKDEWLERLPENRKGRGIFDEDDDDEDDDDDGRRSESHKCSKVLSHCRVVVGDDECETKTITATGRHFNPNERAICATFDDDPIVLTATGGTVQENAAGYTAGVKANASGNWTATFQIPEGTKPGVYYVEFTGRNPSDLGDVWNVCEASYTADEECRDQRDYVHQSCSKRKKKEGKHHNKHSMLCKLAHGLGLGHPSKNLRRTSNGPISHTIATAIAEANVKGNGVAVSASAVATAVSGMYSKSSASATAYTSTTSGYAYAYASAYASSSSGSTSAVAIAKAFASVSISQPAVLPPAVISTTIEEISLNLTDPLAQIFTTDADPYISSIKLKFKTKPTTKPVAVSIATVDSLGIPTSEYLGTAYVEASSISTTLPTEFVFDPPVYARENTDYAIVVACPESATELKYAVFGQKDETTGKLVVKGAQIGKLYESPQANKWQPVAPECALWFQVNRVNFTNQQTFLTTGKQTFPGPVSIIAMQCPYQIPASGLFVTYQYSLNNSQWIDMAPDIENDLPNSVTELWFRIKLDHTNKLCPIVINTPVIEGWIYTSPGAYVHREFSLPQADSQYVDIFVDTDLPGGTTVACYVSYDQQAWELMEEVEDDALVIDNVWTERHYTYDAGAPTNQDVRCKIVLTSSTNYAAPRIAQPVVLAR